MFGFEHKTFITETEGDAFLFQKSGQIADKLSEILFEDDGVFGEAGINGGLDNQSRFGRDL